MASGRSKEFWDQYVKANPPKQDKGGHATLPAEFLEQHGTPTGTYQNQASSRVAGAWYWKPHQRMAVTWRDGGQPYYYNDIDASEWRRFTTSKSPGKFVNRVLGSKPYGPIGG
jgi:KTSC domain-containing protein